MSVRRSLPQCEYAVQRKNLLRVCGMALKSVVDKFCFEGVLSDTDPDVRNLLVILENILMHRCKAQSGKWFSEDTPSYWPCIVIACSRLKRSCVPVVTEMGSHFTGMALGRIFIQMALMERRLSEYLSELVDSDFRNVLRKSYEADAFMMKDEGAALPHICLGLNAIDFSFCPKGENLDYQYVPCIDFTPYLDFSPCSQAVLDDEHEQAVLKGEIDREQTSVENEAKDDEVAEWKAKYQLLYVKYRDLSHQKSYAEEMLGLKQGRIEKLETDTASCHQELESVKASHQRDITQLQGIIMELQTELSKQTGRERSLSDRRRLELYLTGLSTNGKFHEAIALKDIKTARSRNHSFPSMDGVSVDDQFHHSYGEIREGVDALESLTCAPASNRSAAPRDSDSMRPLTGSSGNISQISDS